MTQDLVRNTVILDTDIGSDVDDAMALAVLLGSQEVDLLGVTTVYGDTQLRAQLAQRYARLAGRSIHAVAGNGAPRSKRRVWWPGHEGSMHRDLAAEPIDASTPAAQYLAETVAGRPGEIDVIAIGPLTNIADALTYDGAFASNVRHLWVMGGAFGEGEAEHNFRSDATAASAVFDSGIPATVVGLEITRRLRVGGSALTRIAAAGPLGAALNRDIAQWLEMWGSAWSVPHDPIAALLAFHPVPFAFSSPGVVVIDPRGDLEGNSHFFPQPDGNVRLVTNLDSAAVLEQIVGRITAAGEP